MVLVDGNAHQIETIRAEAKARDQPVTIIIDFVHVLEYLWKAGWCFHTEGDPAIETWVAEQARLVLAGRAHRVAGTIQRKIAAAGLDPARRKGADTCVTYLLNKARYLRYHKALVQGLADRHRRHRRSLPTPRQRPDGHHRRRWGLDGAEAVLKLRALTSNGDLDEYWAYHLQQEKQRVHTSRYASTAIPS